MIKARVCSKGAGVAARAQQVAAAGETQAAGEYQTESNLFSKSAIAARPKGSDAIAINKRQAYWFSTSHPHEDVGFGPEAITLHFVSP
jgi:hypothetical protein